MSLKESYDSLICAELGEVYDGVAALRTQAQQQIEDANQTIAQAQADIQEAEKFLADTNPVLPGFANVMQNSGCDPTA